MPAYLHWNFETAQRFHLNDVLEGIAQPFIAPVFSAYARERTACAV